MHAHTHLYCFVSFLLGYFALAWVCCYGTPWHTGMVASSKCMIQKLYSLEFFKIGMLRTNCGSCTTFVGVSSLLWVPVGKNYRGTYSFGVEWMKTKNDQKWPKQHPDHCLQANLTLFKSIYRKIKKVLTLLPSVCVWIILPQLDSDWHYHSGIPGILSWDIV